jgi:CRISPR-associated exonuclease Cas4
MAERVNGTLIWYYYICRREVWLMGHQIMPDQENDNIIIGRTIAEHSYGRDNKEIVLDNIKIDTMVIENGQICISEVKKSSRYHESAMMQLAFYLEQMQERGLDVRGELRFPKEKIREEVYFDNTLKEKLQKTKQDILHILHMEQPPEPDKNKFCRQCAYAEFCWC